LIEDRARPRFEENRQWILELENSHRFTKCRENKINQKLQNAMISKFS